MRRRFAGLVGLLVVVVAACGGSDGDAAGFGNSSSTKTVRIEMRDIAYSPDTVEVQKGDTVRFIFTNKGKLPHDAFVGDESAQAAHEEEMRGGGGDEHGGHGAGGVTVKPGKTAELEETFDKAGTTFIGCHEPGHYEAGMKITVTVA